MDKQLQQGQSMRSCKWWLAFSNAWVLACVLYAHSTFAVVNIDKTRIIFSANESSQTLNLKNSPDNPTIVQIWSDDGDIMQSPTLTRTPVFAMPPVMKLLPDEQRVIRLMLLSQHSLPMDKESLYWLNLYQIPALAKETSHAERKVVLPLRLRLKVFIRPAALTAPTQQDVQRLRFESRNQLLTIVNPTPWFMSLRLQIEPNKMINNIMVAPKGNYTLPLKQPLQINEKISFEVFDDNGNPVHYFAHLH
ncbi:fimbrial assembly chaperone [Pantoea sp. NPDC088449]|uniref:fimbrial assembly chaperone n=1 Tax=Pantoea sp. NPDC088449 TaxID=3364392 RepID=UPI00382C8B0E